MTTATLLRDSEPDVAEQREAWLHEATSYLRGFFSDLGAPLPEQIRLSCGWPRAGSSVRENKAIGTTWYSAEDGVPQVYISPELIDADQVLGTLIHELVHCACGIGEGHGKKFSHLARALGLAGPLRATVPSEICKDELLKPLSELIGQYPHSKLKKDSAGGTTGSGAGSRMLKLSCPNCGYSVRTTQKWLDVGYPSCPEGDELELEVK